MLAVESSVVLMPFLQTDMNIVIVFLYSLIPSTKLQYNEMKDSVL